MVLDAILAYFHFIAIPVDEQRRIRRLVMIEVLAALIPLFAVITSRGLGR